MIKLFGLKDKKEMVQTDVPKIIQAFEGVPFKYTGPKWDAHTHLNKIEDTQELVKYALEYHVEKMTAIFRDSYEIYEKNFPKKFVFARFLNQENFFKKDVAAVINDIEDMHAKKVPIVKMWYAPRWRTFAEERYKIKIGDFQIDDPKLLPIYKKMEDLSLKLLIHVSDPDIFYKLKYQPESFFGTKAQHMKELESILSHFPNLKIQVAHFAGQPENLTLLGKWFDKYPNLYVDTGSARWMVREFSYNPEKVVDFFKTYKDRIFFGTDIVTGRTDREPIPDYYYVRYLSFQTLFETDVRNFPLPIEDPENNNHTVINGLDLPLSILRKIYWENCKKFHS